jgi:hypothetical protein
MPFDEVLEAPVLEVMQNNTKNYYTECFVTHEKKVTVNFKFFGYKTYSRTYIIGGRELNNSYTERLYKYSKPKESISNYAYAAICPDFMLN